MATTQAQLKTVPTDARPQPTDQERIEGLSAIVAQTMEFRETPDYETFRFACIQFERSITDAVLEAI